MDVQIPAQKRLFTRNIPERSTSFNWGEVTGVFMFKRDCWTVDLICAAFELNNTSSVELNEEMVGWKDLVATIPLRLQGAMPQDEWFPIVAFPAFATNWTRIYPAEREAAGDELASESPSA